MYHQPVLEKLNQVITIKMQEVGVNPQNASSLKSH